MWNVLHTSPHGEPQVCKFLALHGVESYAPEFPPPPRTRPGSVRDRRPRWVFPGYVFFRIPQGFSRWDLIRWAPGVRRLLQEDGVPAIIPDEVVQHLSTRLTERVLTPVRSAFTAGAPVVVDRGPLRMVDAIFERQLRAPERVRILIQLLGREVPVEIDAATIRG